MCADDATRPLSGLIDGARTIIVGAHIDPDGDAIGSTLGLTRALRLAGHDAVAVLADPADNLPVTYAFLPGAGEYRAADTLTSPDLFIALDTPTFARLGDAEPLARSAADLVVIDHHPDNARYGTVSVVDPTASSVGAMVWELLGQLGLPRDEAIATCLYTALVTDTGRFSYSNTTPRALRTAAEMIEAGVDAASVFTSVYESRSAGALQLIGRTLERITCLENGRIAYSRVDASDFVETGASPAEGENLIDQVRSIGGAEIVFLLKTGGDRVRVSLRAKGGADVGSIARVFGGGGHAAAAGFTFEGDADALLERLLPALRGAL